ncbi:MAG: cyclomaltodextrinase C-terminal domain-containing protein, partial [Bacteroidota bacterium]
EYPNFNIVGEEWSPNPAIVAHWQGGKVNPNGYTSCLPSVMDFPLQIALTQSLITEENFSDGLTQTYEMLANDFLYADPSNLVIFPDNHDMDRFFTQVNQDTDLFRLGISFILTTRGIPQIYYGTELLMANPGNGDHGLIREDFLGGWPNDAANAITGKGLTAEQKDTQKFFKTLLQWRKDNTAIHKGKLMHYAPENGIYVYFRYLDDQKIMIVLSKNEEEVTLDLSRFREILSKGEQGTEILTDKQFTLDDKLQVPARTPLIIDVRKNKQRLSTAEVQ